MTAPTCPFCGEETVADEVDIGVGVIRGPEGCPACGAYQGDDEREWRPPEADRLPAEAFRRLVLEVLALRRVEAAARPLLGEDHSHDDRPHARLRWSLAHLDEVRS